jgi:DNA-binding response OmpR family regulator
MNENEKTILVIDDDIDFQFMVTLVLQRCGYAVKSLVEGKVKSTIESAKSCDIVLLDVDLPGVSGVDLGKELKSVPETLNIPIIMLTAHTECEKLFIECGANALLKKPFSLSALLSKINELLSVDRSSSKIAQSL